MDRRLLLPGIVTFLFALLVIGAIIYFLKPSFLGKFPSLGVQTTSGMAQPANGAANTAQIAPGATPNAVAIAPIPTAIPLPPPATPTPAPIVITAVPAIEVPTAVAPGQPDAPADPNPPVGDVNVPSPDYSPAPCNTRVTHTVRVGENLFRIALRYRTTAAAVARMNGITNVRSVSVGQRLRILVCGRGYNSSRATRGAAYVVQPGDTVFRIALRYGVNVQYLCSVNRLYSNLIVPGQTLIIP